jgi:hypothetical protein
MSLEETESAFSSKIRRKGGFASAFLPLLMVFALGTASAGAILLWISSDMPVFTNSAVAERVWSGQECEPGVPNPNPPECDTETWVRSMRGLSTSKWDYHDIGSGLIASALTLLAFLLCFHLRGERTLRSLRTPRHVGAVLAIFAASWLLQIPAFIFSRQIEIERRYGPPWADAQSMSTHIANFGVLVLSRAPHVLVLAHLFPSEPIAGTPLVDCSRPPLAHGVLDPCCGAAVRMVRGRPRIRSRL